MIVSRESELEESSGGDPASTDVPLSTEQDHVNVLKLNALKKEKRKKVMKLSMLNFLKEYLMCKMLYPICYYDVG